MNGLILAMILGSLVPGPKSDINIVRAPCPEYPARSCTFPGGPIYWAPTDTRGVLLHELGHQFDYADMTDADRADIEAIDGDPRPWRSPPNSPHEQFAERYRLCAMYPRLPRDYMVGYGLRLGPKRFQRSCAIIKRAAAR